MIAKSLFHSRIFINEYKSCISDRNAFASGGPKSRKIQFPPPLVTLLISAQFAGKKLAGNFFIRRVVGFLELINENSEYSKCKSQERTP